MNGIIFRNKRRDGKRIGQAGVEYILIIAFLLAVIVPIFLYSMDQTTMQVRTARSKDVVERISIAADNICIMGGGMTNVNIYVPYGAQYSVLANKTVKLGITIGDGVGEAFATTMCNVSGSIPLASGPTIVSVLMAQNGTIMVS